MFTSIPQQYLPKKNCKSEKNKCNHLLPYNEYELEISDLSDNEKKEKKLQFDTSCKNRGGEISRCCDRSENKDNLLNILDYKKPKGKVQYNTSNILESITLCNTKDCDSDYKELSSYELCKISDNLNSKNKITNFLDDCYTTQCNPQEKLGNINQNIDEDYSYEFDKLVVSAIKNNNIDLLKHYISEDSKLLKRYLVHNSEGNTVYHQALIFGAEKILLFLFTNIDKEIINKVNNNGETILHLIMGKDNINLLIIILKLGANINQKNNKNETPIYYGIRKSLFNNVRIAINNNASLYTINSEGNTPLMYAILNKKRNMMIINLLIKKGSDINVKKNNKTILDLVKNKKNKDKIDFEIISLLENLSIKSLNLEEGKELSVEDTKKLEGLVYELENKEEGKDYKFNITYEFEEKKLEFPNDLHFSKNLEQKNMQPYDISKDNYSHEPYYQKFKELEEKKIKNLRQLLQLVKWDKKRNINEKLKIIDKIANKELSYSIYKKMVTIDNNITKEQLFLLDNIKEEYLKDFDSPIFTNQTSPSFSPSLSQTDLELYSKINSINNKETPYDINYKNKIEDAIIETNPSPSEEIDDEYSLQEFINEFGVILFGSLSFLVIVLIIVIFIIKKKK